MPDSYDNIYHRELQTILKFGSFINSSLKIETVLDNAMKCAEEFINAEASTIYEKDEENKELFIRLARGEKKDPVKNIRVKVGEGIAGYVVETEKPMVVNDVNTEKRFSDRFDRLTGFKTRSMVCVPLILRGTTIGAVQVLNKKEGKNFNHHDLEILTGLSHQIAVAIENAKLYERLEQKLTLASKDLESVQEKLIRTERIAAMGHIVNGVAHEIRNPVMVIGGFARRLKSSFRHDPEVSRYSEIILGETARLERLVEQVHRLSDVQVADLKPGNITPVIDRAVKKFEIPARNQKITIRVFTEKNIPDINMDESQIFTMLSNLLENAVESMSDGGYLTVRAEADEKRIMIEIADTGSGIEEKDINSVYDPFVTSKTSGAGLGLTMVHQIVNNHNGEINIKSSKNRGTVIQVKFPVLQH